ncbi:TolC family protein [Gemmobacter sp.]|uniref:TolC family protein n=1 Tax=Gemmobacter sp. TaxID=1898957 RepID=UPI002AFE44DC|nr:TolC family protein [Gemmobacter sp.]
MVDPTFRALKRGVSLAALALALSGCAVGGLIPGAAASKSAHSPGQEALAARPERKVDGSGVIADLASRRTVIPAGSSYDRIARAVLAADAGSARAELRVKQLTAEARSKNWLPSLGPSVSLTSLSSVATSLLLNQTLFDFGRRKAEREYAVADVEVAAVNLSVDGNRRVYQALSLYVDAEAARARGAMAQTALGRLAEFDRIMALRVQGGVSNMSEQTVLKQKLNEMQATLQSDRDAELLAASELDAMAQRPVSASAGLTQLPGAMPGVTPLSVHLAEAEKERTIAELKVNRADYLPGLGASTDLGKGGIGVSGDITNGIGPGSKAALEAVTAGAEAATARVAQAGQDAARKKQALELKIANLDRQEAAQADVARQMRENLKRFEDQYKAGVRPLMDLVTQHENLAAMERDLVNMRHERARARLEIARDLGVLADGAGI